MGETGLRVTPEELLDLLAPAFAHWQAQFTAYGFAPIRTAWLARAARLGERIVARTVTDTHDGTFEGIDADGALLLRAAHGLRTIPAADVFFLRTAHAFDHRLWQYQYRVLALGWRCHLADMAHLD